MDSPSFLNIDFLLKAPAAQTFKKLQIDHIFISKFFFFLQVTY